jgi:hypothetical protein
MCTRLIASLVFAASTPLFAAAQVAATAPTPATPAVAPVAAPSPQEAPQAAQAPQAPQPAQAPAAPSTGSQSRAARAETRAASQQERAETRQRRPEAVQSKGVNVRIDATVIESRGEQVTGRKVLTITLVDGEWGSVRSAQQVPFQPKGSAAYSYRTSPLNMDARATLREDGRIKVALTLEYRGGPSDVETSPAPAPGTAVVTAAGAMDEGIRQNVTVVLESGKPLVVAQSADAVGDRRVALEVKATVLK